MKVRDEKALDRIIAARTTLVLEHPFFDQKPPKSLDRNDFPATPVQGLSAPDGAATPSDIYTVECKLDSDSYANCISGSVTYGSIAALDSGLHTLSVRVTDKAGNVYNARNEKIEATAPIEKEAVGQDPAKLAELKVLELQQMTLFGELLAKLKSTQEEGGTLLDRTIVMFGSNLGNASSHDNKNLPIMVAGGVGSIRAMHVEKSVVKDKAQIVVLGGPAMLIGLGGGAASSMASWNRPASCTLTVSTPFRATTMDGIVRHEVI